MRLNAFELMQHFGCTVIIVGHCGRIDLVASGCGPLNALKLPGTAAGLLP
jgi:hypothetical protein